MNLAQSLGLGLGPPQIASQPLPAAPFGFITSTKDGSVGQTYTLNAAWTEVQWYRRGITPPFTITKINGATSLTYVATSADINCRLVAVGKSGASSLASLSYQIVLEAPILLESFDSLTGFTAANGTIALNTNSPAQGTGKLEFIPPGTNLSPNATKTNAFSLNAPDVATDHYAFCIDFGCLDDFDLQSCLGCTFQLAEGGSSTYQTVTNISGPTGLNSVTRRVVGKMWWSVAGVEVPGFATFITGNKNLRMQSAQGEPYANHPKVDGLIRKAKSISTPLITFDDIRTGPFDYGLDILDAYGLKATWFVAYSLVGQANRLTLAQLQHIKSRGHTIALNLTADDNIITAKASVQAVIDEYLAGKAYLEANGLDSIGKYFVCYSNGVAFSNATPVAKTGITADGSTTVLCSNTTSLVDGMYATGINTGGVNIPPGTRIATGGIVTNTSITLTNAVAAGTTRISFVDNSGIFHGTKLRDAMITAGVKVGRTTITSPRTSFYSRNGLGDQALWLPGTGVTGLTNITMRTELNLARDRGEDVIYYIHNLQNVGALGDPNPNIDASVLNFADWAAQIGAGRDAGNMDPLNMEDWYGKVGSALIAA
jgi:hypothetical protein